MTVSTEGVQKASEWNPLPIIGFGGALLAVIAVVTVLGIIHGDKDNDH